MSATVALYGLSLVNANYGNMNQTLNFKPFKGYLRYKTTFQNVLSEAQVQNFFIL